MRLSSLLAVAALLLTGCAGLPRATVTVTSVVDSAMKTWAQEHVAGRTTPEIDAKIRAAHERYRLAAGTALVAYQTYLAQGDDAAALRTVRSLRALAIPIVEALWPVNPGASHELTVNLQRVTHP